MKREYSIYKTLKCLAKQRVAMVLQPGNVWIIERALPNTDEHQENLQTCLMRGWIEVLEDSVPSGAIRADGELASGRIFEGDTTIYRLTDSGWNAIHRGHVIALLGIVASLLGILVTIVTATKL